MIHVAGLFYLTRISAGKTTSYMLKTMPERNLCELDNLNPRIRSYLLLSLALREEWEGNSRNEVASTVHYYFKNTCTVNYLQDTHQWETTRSDFVANSYGESWD